MNKKRFVALCVVLLLATLSVSLISCNKDESDKDINPLLNLEEEIELVFAGNAASWPEMEKVITKFETKYPNCTIKYEFIENYDANLPVRLDDTENKIDVFRSNNVFDDTVYKDNCLNLIDDYAQKYLDLSKANAGLVKNFKFTQADNTQYAVPYAGELRGLYVNKTLLAKYNLSVPSTWDEMMNCCSVLLANGYIPFQAPVASFAQQLLYPYICNSIVHSDDYAAKYAAIDNIDDGIAEYFRSAYTKLYEIVSKGYYNYKKVETDLGYKFSDNLVKSKEFLNITLVEGSTTEYVKNDDVGEIAFMTDTQGFALSLDKAKTDYHSAIEYEFILAPVTNAGGYGYLSPSGGLAVNKNSDHTDWALEFLDFVFSPSVNKDLATDEGKIPNVNDEILKMNVTDDRICTVGDMTFSFGFYKVVTALMLTGYDDMVGISKMNASKYMVDDGNGGTTFKFTVNDYITRLEQEFQKIKTAREAQ